MQLYVGLDKDKVFVFDAPFAEDLSDAAKDHLIKLVTAIFRSGVEEGHNISGSA